MNNFDYDLFVIGAGSGGVRASRVASGHGARVAICEKFRVGGTCVIRGCIPKKLLVYASHFREDFIDASFYGWKIKDATFDWSNLILNKDKEIDRLNKIYINILNKNNVNLYNGVAKFLDKNTIDINGKKVTSEKILIATGGKPYLPNIEGNELAAPI